MTGPSGPCAQARGLREGALASFLVWLRDSSAAYTVNLPAKRISFSGDKHGVIRASAEGKK